MVGKNDVLLRNGGHLLFVEKNNDQNIHLSIALYFFFGTVMVMHCVFSTLAIRFFKRR